MLSIGQKVGMLEIIEFQGKNKNNRRLWLCKCDCGKVTVKVEENIVVSPNANCGCSPCWKGHNKRFKDLTGETYGKLTVRCFCGKDKYSHNLWLCDCECGGTAITDTSALKQGKAKSCGCLHKQRLIDRNTTHGKSKTRLYKIYSHMIERCYNPKCKGYKDYGNRGIKVCDEWQEFTNFYRWALENGYKENLTIDRINVNGNYEPSNCRWATMLTQSNNKRNTIKITFDNEVHTLSEWSRLLDLEYIRAYKMYKKGEFEDYLQNNYQSNKYSAI